VGEVPQHQFHQPGVEPVAHHLGRALDGLTQLGFRHRAQQHGGVSQCLSQPGVTIEEVTSGEWGIGGKPLRTGDIVGMRSAAAQ
jgi:hypothetical protein